MSSEAKKKADSGEIGPGLVLTVDAFCRRMDVGRTHVTNLRRRGLPVRGEGGKFLRILSDDYIEFVKTLPVVPVKGDEDAGPNDSAA